MATRSIRAPNPVGAGSSPPFTFFFLHACTAWPIGVIGLALSSSLVNAGVPVQRVGAILATPNGVLTAVMCVIPFGAGTEAGLTGWSMIVLVLGFAWSPRTAVWFMTVELVYRAMATAIYATLLGIVSDRPGRGVHQGRGIVVTGQPGVCVSDAQRLAVEIA